MKFNVGDFVGVPVQYAKGAFENELMISFSNDDEMISGFVRRENLRFIDDRNAFLKAEVLSISDEVKLRLFGSFFTTNGIEPFQADWAKRNLNLLEIAA